MKSELSISFIQKFKMFLEKRKQTERQMENKVLIGHFFLKMIQEIR